MEIKILGTGCPKCKSMERVVRNVVSETGIDVNIIRVNDIMDIVGYGIMTTPALVIDEQVLIKGRVPSSKEIMDLLKKLN